MSLVSTQGVLLRSHAYGDTSRIYRFFTEKLGLVGVMAKGVRTRNARDGSGLSTFAGGTLTLYVKHGRDLHTMKDFSCARPRSGLGGDVLRFAGASAVAELILNHAGQEPNPALFAALEGALDGLHEADADALPTATLAAAWWVVSALGYRPTVSGCVRCGATLGADEMGRFDLAAGGVRCAACGADAAGPRLGPGARAQLRALLQGRYVPPVSHARRHLALLADFVAYHVASKRLTSLEFLAGLLPDHDA